ncbi:UDP-glucose dehydrogenase [Salinibacter ruber DSM 13855]|uniref:UDP-glucose 6-dehydrogenase n=1 Tax=Salinibacter ruber (strain DSM 13855 / M31) TaxID=309807 RepID=Q2S4Z2_SALRD|nr:UDP-glucose dehydrogenase [Salinibacter ruber DSM 13855]
MQFSMEIAVIGTGYVGLVSGTCFAEMGHDVTCVDIDEEKVAQLSSGELPIYEPDLEKYFERARSEGRLHFTTDLAEGIDGAKVIFFALPTPPGEDGSADLTYVKQAAGDVADLFASGTLQGPKQRIVVNKSTVPVGTGEEVEEVFAERSLEHGTDVAVVSNPEFLREGSAVEDFMKPDRVVIGTEIEWAAEEMERLYEPFVRQGNPILTVDRRSAEMIKYAANSLLATRISFMNEIANVCERVGANVDKVRLGISKDHRIGAHFLYAGIGFGGGLLPEGREGAGPEGRGGRLRAEGAGGHPRRQRLAAAAPGDRGERALRRRPLRQEDRGVGPVLQAGDRRHTGGALPCNHPRATGRRRRGRRVRSGGDGDHPRDLRGPDRVRGGDVRGARRGRRADHLHRVARVSAAGPGQSEKSSRPADCLRRAEPVRPGPDGGDGL